MTGLDLASLAADVGPPSAGAVAAVGLGTRGGPMVASPGPRLVTAPTGIAEFLPAEMTVRCGAGMPVDELQEALGEHRQEVALPAGGTVGGALAVGRSDELRLGRGPVRDVLLQARYVSAAGEVVRAGGATVKNVSGFDLCRLLVGSRGTLGVLGEVILRTRPRPPERRWFQVDDDPDTLLVGLYRPTAILWDGDRCAVCLEGHPVDVERQAARWGLQPREGPPSLPGRFRWSVPPVRLAELAGTGRFVAEIGVGVVHHADLPPPAGQRSRGIDVLQRRVKAELDPSGRFPALTSLGG